MSREVDSRAVKRSCRLTHMHINLRSHRVTPRLVEVACDCSLSAVVGARQPGWVTLITPGKVGESLPVHPLTDVNRIAKRSRASVSKGQR